MSLLVEPLLKRHILFAIIFKLQICYCCYLHNYKFSQGASLTCPEGQGKIMLLCASKTSCNRVIDHHIHATCVQDRVIDHHIHATCVQDRVIDHHIHATCVQDSWAWNNKLEPFKLFDHQYEDPMFTQLRK